MTITGAVYFFCNKAEPRSHDYLNAPLHIKDKKHKRKKRCPNMPLTNLMDKAAALVQELQDEPFTYPHSQSSIHSNQT